jgi:cytochrome c biogenesis protein CcmG, thiol:disulfide interchange protein DsbE
MTRYIASLVLTAAFGLLGLAATAPAWALQVGDKAPAFSLPGATGDTPVTLQAQAGKVVYLDFWASWCGPCRQSFPWLNDMQKKYGAKGFTVMGINVDKKREDADKFLAATPAQFTLAFDAAGKTPKEWKVMGMPSSFLIGRDGSVQVLHAGFRDEDRAELEAKIEKALAGGGAK